MRKIIRNKNKFNKKEVNINSVLVKSYLSLGIAFTVSLGYVGWAFADVNTNVPVINQLGNGATAEYKQGTDYQHLWRFRYKCSCQYQCGNSNINKR